MSGGFKNKSNTGGGGGSGLTPEEILLVQTIESTGYFYENNGQYKLYVTVGATDADYLFSDYASDDLAIQAAVDAVALTGETVFVKDDATFVNTVTILTWYTRITHIGNITLSGASGTAAYRFGDNSTVVRFCHITLKNIDGIDQDAGRNGIVFHNSSGNKVTLGYLKNCNVGLYFTSRRFDENIIEYITIQWCNWAAYCDTPAKLGEGNEFHGGSIFNCQVGCEVVNGALFGYMYWFGTMDNQALPGTFDIINNMAFSQGGSSIFLKYVRPEASTFMAKDLVFLSGDGRMAQVYGIESIKEIGASLSGGRGATYRHMFFNALGGLQYNALTADTEVFRLSRNGVTTLYVQPSTGLTVERDVYALRSLGVGTNAPLSGTATLLDSDLFLAHTSITGTALYGRTDGTDSYLNNMNNFATNGSTGNGRLIFTGQTGMKFKYGSVGSSGTEAMGITSAGDINIGATAPITGSLTITAKDLFIQHTDGGTSFHARSDGTDTYLNNMNNFVSNGSAGNGRFIITGQTGVILRYGSTGVSGTTGFVMDSNGDFQLGGAAVFTNGISALGKDIVLFKTALGTSAHIRTDGTDTYINNVNNFVSNGSTGNGRLIISGQTAVSIRYGSSGTAGLEGFNLNASGNIGLQTASQTANFQVAQPTAGIGTVSNSAGGTTVTGVGTQFLNTFRIGDTITINAETVVISAIASDTSMTVAAITGANSGVIYTLVGGNRVFAYGNGLVKSRAGSTASKMATIGGKIKEFFTDVGNVGTGEDDLYSYTTEANLFGVNGDTIEADFGGVFVSSATATRQIKLWFGGTAIFDTGALTLSLSSSWNIYGVIVRVSATVVRYTISLTTQGAALSAYTASGELTGLTLSGTNILKLTGESAGVGAATNDIVAKVGVVRWYPAAI